MRGSLSYLLLNNRGARGREREERREKREERREKRKPGHKVGKHKWCRSLMGYGR